MKYDFDAIIPREKTLSVKWNPAFYSNMFNGNTGLLPLWVADMDFRVSRGIMDRLDAVRNEGIFGYTKCDAEYFDAVVNWYARRHGMRFSPEHIVFTPGIVPAINYIIQAFTDENDALIIQPPVYYPFKNTIINNNRRLVTSPLIEVSPGRYAMDYEDFEKKVVANNVRMFILCNPHNPVGRVWSREELAGIADICLRYDVLVLSDEIHCDLTFFGNKYTPFLSLSPEVAERSFTCNAASKTFNLAGLQASNVIIPNKELRERYQRILEKHSLTLPNAFAPAMIKGAYLDSDDWYEQMIAYIEGNITFASEYIASELHPLAMRKQECTYLGWIDARALKLSAKEMEELCECKAKVAFDYGHWFGEEGQGFLRINLACPRSVVKEALDRLKTAIRLP